jgi:O-antigen/teichoic acid export membrane protein
VRGSRGSRTGRSPASGEARLLAHGALLQQLAQGSGLLALLVIVTVLARRLSVTELGAYGLVASLSGYLLVIRNGVASSTVRAMASAIDTGERSRLFATAAALYAAVGAATGVLIALVALAIAGVILDGELARQARAGGVGLGAVTAVGIACSVYLDALRAERLFALAALGEIAGVLAYLCLMLALILGGSGLAVVMAFSGAMPLLSGLVSLGSVRRLRLPLRLSAADVSRRRAMEILPTSGWLLVIELCNLAMYALDRVVLGVFRSARTVGLYEGAVRAHNLLYALAGALAVPTVPTASRYVATGDERRLGALVVRGSRYTLALFVPVCVTLMALSGPLLEVWLGARYREGSTALAILVSYWLLYGGLVATPGFLVGAGRAREAARILMLVAAANVALSLALTPAVGLEGPALGTTIPFVLAFPFLLRVGLGAAGVPLAELATRAWLPAYSLGAALAAVLVALRVAVDLASLAALVPVAVGGLIAYWLAFYALWLGPEERELVRGLAARRRAA